MAHADDLLRHQQEPCTWSIMRFSHDGGADAFKDPKVVAMNLFFNTTTKQKPLNSTPRTRTQPWWQSTTTTTTPLTSWRQPTTSKIATPTLWTAASAAFPTRAPSYSLTLTRRTHTRCWVYTMETISLSLTEGGTIAARSSGTT